jgi:hypothetical protein
MGDPGNLMDAAHQKILLDKLLLKPGEPEWLEF